MHDYERKYKCEKQHGAFFKKENVALTNTNVCT